MKLAVFGATGQTGRHLVTQALGQGHEVTALVRNSAKLADIKNHKLTVSTVDVMDQHTLQAHLRGQDAVLSAIGPTGNGPTTVCTDSAQSIVEAMRRTGGSRLLVVSAAGPYTDGDGPFTRFLVKPMLRRMLRHSFTDIARMEEIVHRSGLDWTAARPPLLTDKAATGRYRMQRGRNVRRGFRIPRADLADAMLYMVRDDSTVGTPVGVAT